MHAMKYGLPVLMIMIIVSCGIPEKKVHRTKKEFSLPDIPFVVSGQKQRTEYLAWNYWMNFDFNDTVQLKNTDFMDKIFGHYAGLLVEVDPQIASKSLNELLAKASQEKKVFQVFIEYCEKNFYDPNSQYRNEYLYMTVLGNILTNQKLSSDEKLRYRCQYDLALKNRVGELANNFRYALKSGLEKSMYDLKSDFLILYFNNPGCHDCQRVSQLMSKSVTINRMLKKGKLKILSLYPNKNLAEWNKHLSEFPAVWINAYDKGAVIEKQMLYDLKAIPTLYLLDSEKRVILKDVPFEQIEHFIFTRS
jgi:hypothetical protein